MEVIGDESREKIYFKHNRFNLNGFQNHKNVFKILKKTSISVVCSRWNEPFGRTSLESSSHGCATIISNRGGLPETTSDALILKKIDSTNLYILIKKLIIDEKLRNNLQINSIKNFYLTNKFVSKLIDDTRERLSIKYFIKKNKKLKILHITNFNERHNGRLFYNTGRRINNGLVRSNHSVLTISDRDIVSYHRSLKDFDGSKKLNSKIIDTIANYLPDLIILGHADLVSLSTLKFIKKNYPSIKITQWFLDKMNEGWKKNKRRFLDKIELMDCSFCTTSPDALSFPKKYKIFYMPNPADSSFETLKCYDNKYPVYDLFFAMSHGVHRGILKKGKFDQRSLIINELIKKNPNIKFNLHGLGDEQPVWSDDFKLSLKKSKMALNLSQGKPTKYYSSDRIAQLIGNGILTFVDIKTKLNKFFSNDEVIFYKSMNDLSKKINFYKVNHKIRNKIAKKGKEKYLKHFNSNKIANFIIDKSMNFKKINKYFWE